MALLKHKYLIGNWKSGPESPLAVKEFLKKIEINQKDSLPKIGLAIPTLYLELAKQSLQNKKIQIWAQDCASSEMRNQTGLIRPSMLKHYVEGIIINHSENKTKIDNLASKLILIHQNNLKIIICIEKIPVWSNQQQSINHEQKAWKKIFDYIHIQKISQQNNIFFALEPQIAVNQKNPININEWPKIFQNWEIFCKKILGYSLPLFYGGAIDEADVQNWWNVKNISGLLIGRKSWDIINWNLILNKINQLKQKKT